MHPTTQAFRGTRIGYGYEAGAVPDRQTEVARAVIVDDNQRRRRRWRRR